MADQRAVACALLLLAVQVCVRGCDVNSVPSTAGDGYCDSGDNQNNADDCYDGGDCCATTCSDGLYGCGVGGYNCAAQPTGFADGVANCTTLFFEDFNYADCDGTYTLVSPNRYEKSNRAVHWMESCGKFVCCSITTSCSCGGGYWGRLDASGGYCMDEFQTITQEAPANDASSVLGDLSTMESDYAALTNGVSSITTAGAAPGRLVLYGGSAFALLQDEGGKTFMAAARLDSGRVVAMAHTTYVTSSTMNADDGAALINNVVTWLGGGSPHVGLLSGKFSDLRSYLTSVAIPYTEISSVSELASTPAINCFVISAAEDVDGPTVQAWVAAGGGVFTLHTPWAYNFDDLLDYPGNNFILGSGIVFSPNYPYVNAGTDTFPATMPSALNNAHLAVTALAAFATRQISMTDDEVEAAVSSLDFATSNVPYAFDSALWDSAIALLGTIKPALPTAAYGVVQATNPLARIEASIVMRLPLELMYAHPASADFPGAVPEGAARVTASVTILASYEGRNTQYWYSGAGSDVWRPTGYYAAPGEVISITVPASAVNQGLTLRIGGHSDGLWGKDEWFRFPTITTTTSIVAETTEAANPFGGLVFVTVDNGVSLGEVEVTLANVVSAPLFVQGQTSAEEWLTQRALPTPFGVMVTGKMMLIVPSELLVGVDDPVALMNHWDAVLDSQAQLAGDALDRPRPEAICLDRQISAGYMHSGYPIMAPTTATEVVGSIVTDGGWGYYHELGHNHQLRSYVFTGTTEVSTNLFTLYTYLVVHNKTSSQARPGWNREADRNEYMQPWPADRSFSDWKGDAFLALDTLVLLQEGFGWSLYEAVLAEYLQLTSVISNDDEKRGEFVKRHSVHAEHNLLPFFDAWAIPIGDSYRDEVNALGLPIWEEDPMMKWHGAPLVAATNVAVSSEDTNREPGVISVHVSFTRAADESGNDLTSVVAGYRVFLGTSDNPRGTELADKTLAEVGGAEGEAVATPVLVTFAVGAGDLITVVARSAYESAWDGYHASAAVTAEDNTGTVPECATASIPLSILAQVPSLQGAQGVCSSSS